MKFQHLTERAWSIVGDILDDIADDESKGNLLSGMDESERARVLFDIVRCAREMSRICEVLASQERLGGKLQHLADSFASMSSECRDHRWQE